MIFGFKKKVSWYKSVKYNERTTIRIQKVFDRKMSSPFKNLRGQRVWTSLERTTIRNQKIWLGKMFSNLLKLIC